MLYINFDMLKVACGEQTLGRTLEEFLTDFSKFKSDVSSFEMYWHSPKETKLKAAALKKVSVVMKE